MSHYLFRTLNLRRRVSPQYQHDYEQRLGHFQPWELGDHYQPSRRGLEQSLTFLADRIEASIRLLDALVPF
jgi:hypothetical protein